MRKQKSKLYIFFSNPAFGIIGTTASLISLFFALNLNSDRDLVYVVYPIKSTIVSNDSLSNLKVSYKNNILEGSISSAQIAFWNSGKKSIRENNVLQPLRIKLENESRILEARIKKKSREIIKIDLNENNINKGELGIKWNILEQNDGFVLQLIYNSEPNTKILAEGIIEGQGEISEIKSNINIRGPMEQYNLSKSMNKRWQIIFFSILIFMSIVHYFNIKRRKKYGIAIYQKHDILLLVNIIAPIVTYVYFRFYVISEPPFGF